MGQHQNNFLRTDSRRESATHYLVKPNSFFLLSRLVDPRRMTMSAVRRLFIQLLKKQPAAGAAADGSRLYLYVTETGALSYQGESLEGWRSS
jgi:hypothetical protein